MTDRAQRPTLVGLELGDAPERWEALGFALRDDGLDLGGVRLDLGGADPGISRWSVAGIAPTDEIDGLPTTVASTASPRTASQPKHPNRAIGLDHVVVMTPDFDRSARALEETGMPLRRIRDAGGFRQGFRRLGPCILELVEARRAPRGAARIEPGGPARFWGLVVIVSELSGAQTGAGLLGEARPAVQPGRQIATLRPDAGLGQPVAFMTPEPER